MAMGHTNSVEFGQAAHVAMAAMSGAIVDSEILRLDGKTPRGDYLAGIMIDDHAAVEKEEAAVADPRGRHWEAQAEVPPGALWAWTLRP